jgi:CRISPR-associated endonuclease Cas1
MPHIRAPLAEQSASFPDSIAVALTRDVLRLRKAGSTHRAIATELDVSIRKVQSVLRREKAAKPFRANERDADWVAVAAALVAGSTLAAEHLKYAAHAARPFVLSHFWRRFEDWRAAHGGASFAPGPGPRGTVRKRLGFVAAYDHPETGRALEGGLLFVGEPNVALQIRKGALCIRYRDGTERTFPRGRRHGLQSIILASPGASITIEAARFAMDEGVAITLMGRAGEAVAVLTDAAVMDTSSTAMALRRAQFAASPRQRVDIARQILTMKIEACELPVPADVTKAKTHDELLMLEARAAGAYWKRYVGFRPRLTDRCPTAWAAFRGRLEKRGTQAVPRWARNPCNAALNYGYAVALGNCTRALVGLGLDPAFGFLHHGDAPGRLSLSYDVVELVRPAVDRAVFRLLQSRAFDRKEFVEVRMGQRAGGAHVQLAPKTAREVALRVLSEVPAATCEEAARQVARCILGEWSAARGSKTKLIRMRPNDYRRSP